VGFLEHSSECGNSPVFAQIKSIAQDKVVLMLQSDFRAPSACSFAEKIQTRMNNTTKEQFVEVLRMYAPEALVKQSTCIGQSL
jgi:hypothetical protein